MNSQQLVEKIRRAEEALAVAGGELGDVLKAAPTLPRASKTMVTQVIDDAFERLKVAKAKLAELEELLTKHRK